MTDEERQILHSSRRLFTRIDKDHDFPRGYPEFYDEALLHVRVSVTAEAKNDVVRAVREMGWALFRLGCSI